MIARARQAFTLIEVVIAILIASMLGVVLFQALNQTSRSISTVNGLTVSMFNVMGFYDRFERDVCGAFIPEMGDPERVMQAVQKQVKKQTAQQQKDDDQKSGKQKPGDDKKGDKAEKEPSAPVTLKNVQVKKVFVYEGKGTNLNLFTFITCNPLQVYGQIKPRIARVTYSLADDSRAPGMLKLLRKESPQLGFESGKDARSHVLLRNIKSLRLEFLAPEPEAKEEKKVAAKTEKDALKQQLQNKPKKEKKPLQVYQSWPIAREKVKDEKEKGAPIRDLPRAVRVFLQYHDPYDDVTKPFEFLLPVYNYRAPVELMDIEIMQNLEDLEDKDKDKGDAKSQAGGKSGSSANPSAQQAPAGGKTTP